VTEDTHAGAALGRHAARLVEQADAVALCLDFDGTLAPIVDDPEQTRALPGMVDLLGRLAARFAAVALLSGRPASFLFEHAAAPGVRYLGLRLAGDPRRAGLGRSAAGGVPARPGAGTAGAA
jgi:hypothetical protein